MNPNKSSKRDSRRSSILKPPKPRQPLQTVKLNTSSNESSPTTPKLKRRVSFAEKKHVKEFCDSVEQGTVWDSTYEEHDLSNIKPSFTNQGQFAAENASKENIQTNKPHSKYKDVDFTDTTNDGRENNMELSIPDEIFRGISDQGNCGLKLANLTESLNPAFALQTREEILVQSSPVFLNGAKHNFAACAPKTISVYEDTNKNIPKTVMDQFSQHDACNVSNTELNRTSAQDISMVLTGVIATKKNQPETEMTVKFQDVSMEFTQAVSVNINVLSSNIEKISNAPSIVENCMSNHSDITHHFINKSLDFTECLESVKAKIPDKLEDVQNTEKYNIDRPLVAMDIIEDMSMEFTVPICSLIDPVSNMGNLMPMVPTTFVDNDKTKVFQNASMEITEAVPVVPDIRSISPCEKAQQFHINFPEMGDPALISKTNSKAMSFEDDKTMINNDKTKVFQNASMEITTAVPVVPDIRSISTCKKAQQFHINFPEMGDPALISKTNSKVMSFEEESMEITKAIEQTTRLIDRDRESEKTQLINVPMEMTKPVGLHMSSMQKNIGLNSINRNDLHMFTPVSFEKLDSDIQCLKQIINLDKTKVYIDEPMEFTKAITALPKIRSDDLELHTCKSDNTENISEKTKIFHTSMTTTAVVPEFSTKNNNKETTIMCNEYTDQHNNINKTELFPHTSMEVTEVVPGLVLSETFEQKTFSINTGTSTTLSYEAPKHTTVSLSICPAISSHPMLDKENCVAQYSLNSSARGSSLKDNPHLGVESSANFTASMALHDVEQGICVSALNDNNTEKAYTLTTSEVSPHATSELYQSEHPQDDNLESVVQPKKRMFMEATLDGASTYAPPECNENEHSQDHENAKQSMLRTRRTYTKEETGKHPPSNEVPTLVDPKFNQNKRLQDHENKENGASWRRRTYTKKFKLSDNVSEEVSLSGSRLNQREYLQEHENLETIIPHTRRTFTKEVTSIPSTQTSISNFAVSNNTTLVSNVEISKIPFIQNNTFYCKTNDKQSRAHSTLKYLETSHETANNEACSMDRSVTFGCESIEELESIKPPSFLGSDDSNTLESTSTNNIVYQEGNQISDVIPRELNGHCSESFKLRYNNQDNKLLQDEWVNVIQENVTCNSQTLIDRQKILDVNPQDPGIACDDGISVIEPQKLQLISMNYSDTEKQALNSSASSSINTSERNSVLSEISSPKGINEREVERNNTCMGDQSLHCTSLAARDDCGRINVYNADSSSEQNQTMERIQNDSFNSTKEPCDVYNRLNRSGDRIECSDVQSQKDCDEKDSSIKQDPFASLSSKLKIHAQSDDIIWDICYENIERKMIVVGFIASSLLIVIFFNNDCDIINELIIKEIKIVSRIEDDAGILAHIVHRIILEKIRTEKLMELYKDREDILTMLGHISKEVKLAMDFVFDLKRLSDVNLMEITRDRISFLSHTKRLDIILRVTISVKPFDKIDTNDINVECILGSVREEHIKKLIVNIKRNHKFLRRYVSDVRDYIYLMEESSGAIK